jgi:hypothetical protein
VTHSGHMGSSGPTTAAIIAHTRASYKLAPRLILSGLDRSLPVCYTDNTMDKSWMRPDTKRWLLEPENPTARTFTLLEWEGCTPDGAPVQASQAAIMDSAPVRAILNAQFPAGYWLGPELALSPRYRATVWQVVVLAALGATPSAPVIRACEHLFGHAQEPDGLFRVGRGQQAPRLCVHGSLLRSLLALGYGPDPRLEEAAVWLGRRVEQQGWACACNAGQPCAWGTIKCLDALLRLPKGIEAPGDALDAGTDLLLSQRLLAIGEPVCYTGARPRWQRLGAFLGDDSDVVEALAVLQLAGRQGDPRLQTALAWLRDKADAQGRWRLEIVAGKLWFNPGPIGQPSKWVTLRALRALEGQAGPLDGG